MITEYLIRGYKSLREVRLHTAALNILVGGNSCGKSSVLQTFLLLRQTSKDANGVSILQLSGGLFEAGMARDVLHPEARAGIELEIHADGFRSGAIFSPESSGDADLSPESRKDAVVRELKSKDRLRLPDSLLDESGENFAYLNAERMGPRVVYQLPMPGTLLSGPVGMHGEFTTAFLARCQQSNRSACADWFQLLEKTAGSMPEDLLLDEGSKKNLTRLDLVAKQILGWVVPGTDFQTSEQSVTDSAQLAYVRDPSGTKTLVRPTHMGFGVTYTLPVIVAALALQKTGLLLVENPEAHLHPSSQSRIGIFLALAASQGLQMFVETHSDHVVNGIRLAVKNRLIDARDVKFFFFKKLATDESSSVSELTVSDDGRVSAWPEGFFDQIERDLSRL